MGDYSPVEILGAHVAFLRLMVEAMTTATMPARSEPLRIDMEARALRSALRTVLATASPATLTALNAAAHRVRSWWCGQEPAFAGRVAEAQKPILRGTVTASLGPGRTEPSVEVFALWTPVPALITTRTSEDRLLTACVTKERALTALSEEADKAARLSTRVQIDFYHACLGGFLRDAASKRAILR